MMRAVGAEPPHVGIECGSVSTVRQSSRGSDASTSSSPAQSAVESDAGVSAMRPPPVPVTRTIGITTRQGWRPTAPQAAFVTSSHEVAQAGGRSMDATLASIGFGEAGSTFAKAAGWDAGASAYDINPARRAVMEEA
ncbi:hypothetical protein OY671_011869, partial [Metschnikowia pulcherrima]